MGQLNRLFSTQAIFDCRNNLIFQLIDDVPGKSLHFDLLLKHVKIKEEARTFQ